MTRIAGSLALLTVFLLTAVSLFAGPSRAQTPATDITPALERFSQESLSQTRRAVSAIAESGVPQAQPMLDALLHNRLRFDPATKKVYYRSTDNGWFDAATGKAVAKAPEKLERIRINNRLRVQIGQALGTLRLRAPDPKARIAAAETIFKSKSADALGNIDAALRLEKNESVRTRLEQARAAIIVSQENSTPDEKSKAIRILAARGDQAAIAVLRNLPANADARSKEQAAIAIKTIEDRLALLAYAQNVWYGLSLGSVLLLAAIGLAITFGVMGVINMAHGEMVMLGAYTTFIVQEGFRAFAPDMLDWSLPLALPLAFLVTALVGIAIERGVIRFLYGRALETLLATWGVSLILQQAIRTAFGPTNQEVSAPSYMSGAFDFMGLSITYGRLWIIVFTLLLFVALLLAIRFTRLGLYMRAVTQNRRMAAAMGIRTPWIDAMTFGLGSGLAGLAGVALSQIDNVSPNLGQNYIIDSFMVVVFGGVGNLWGTLVSAMTLGIANKFLEPVAGAVLAKILILVLLILFIQKRPRGLFALRGRAVEA
ncbi:MAG: urea ABC transporter permease subunit UrtB [Hyphomicrobiales bacterium]|nr:urea ABC transporter permease subunit UrtB [Hyphomicrobiales bacterium]